MAPKGGSKQQSEEDLLLQDFSRNLSAKSSALFFGNAFIVSAIPICEPWAGGGGDVAGAAGRPSVGDRVLESHSRRASEPGAASDHDSLIGTLPFPSQLFDTTRSLMNPVGDPPLTFTELAA